MDRNGAWQALVEAQQAGKIRSIGVSNYGLHHLQELEAFIQEMEAKKGKGQAGLISVAQYELHPWCARTEIVDWCTQRGIVLEAYCPIVRGQRSDEPQLQALSKKYGKTPAQILIRWSLQKVSSLTFVVGFVTSAQPASSNAHLPTVGKIKISSQLQGDQADLTSQGFCTASKVRHTISYHREQRRLRLRAYERRS